MAQLQSFLWPQSGADSVCPKQNVMPGQAFQFGTLYKPKIPFPHFVRTLLISSPHNCTLSKIAIQGIVNGKPLKIEVTGPHANTVETISAFSCLNSITLSGAPAKDISIGLGSRGRLGWFQPLSNFSMQTLMSKQDGSQCAWQLMGTLEDPANVKDVESILSPIGRSHDLQHHSHLWTGIRGPFRFVCLNIFEAEPNDHIKTTFLQL
ncbi:hypothetical protein Bealeia2_01942 (plasmid) [Candidatus Bealeia paramacronuclearis]|uniref:hypothetical protein n=1 Tax=Candidatus Bealeia paramacronuclearis TaxID=1921001 RepID=UPI002BC543AA|nr:hypothetical protein [Candidatus Bealeia paramacronuclearis]